MLPSSLKVPDLFGHMLEDRHRGGRVQVEDGDAAGHQVPPKFDSAHGGHHVHHVTLPVLILKF